MPVLDLTDCEVILTDAAGPKRAPRRSFRALLPELSVQAGDRIAVVGPSGSGKSTLLELLALLRAPSRAGTYTMTLSGPGQIDVGALWADRMVRARTRLRARHIGVIASHGGMFPAVSIRRNAHYRAHLAGVPGRLAAERVQAIAERLEISSYLDLRADQLSRGQALRGAILQGLVHLPELIVADEPTASLHPALAGRLFSALGQMAADQKGAAIVATHDAATANAAGFRLLRAVPSGDPAHQMTEFRWAEAREV